MSLSQSAITRWGWGFHTLGSGINPGDLRFRPRVVGVVDMEGFLTRGWELILPGCGGTSAFTRGATLAARWLHEPQPISDHPVGLGFPHPAGRYRTEGSAFTSPGCWSCRYTEGFLIRGWNLSSPGCADSMTIPSQSAIGQWDWGFHTVRGGFDPGDHCFRPRAVGVVKVWKDF